MTSLVYPLAKKSPFFWGGILSLLILSLSACEKPKEIGLNLQPQGKAGVFFTDTCQLKLSTITFDSVATDPLSTVTLLVGKYQDPELGTVTARSFFQPRFSGEAIPVAEGTVVYDSLTLILFVGSATNYGNTEREQLVKIHRLQESPKTDQRYFQFNSLPYDNTHAVGEIRAKPSDVVRKQFIQVRLDDDLGREFANMAQQRFSREAYINAFKGLALVGEPDNDCVWGFTASTFGSVVRLFYKIQGDATPRSIDFFVSGGGRFNQVIADRSGTILAPFNQNHQAVPANSTQNKVFQQYETGLTNKIEIPSLWNLRNLGSAVMLNKAELVLRVMPNSTQKLAPPTTLALYETDARNQFLFTKSPITNAEVPIVVPFEGNPAGAFTTQPASATFSVARQEYRVDITTYLQKRLAQGRDNKAILVFASQSNLLNRLVLNANPNAPNGSKIEITYSVFDKQ